MCINASEGERAVRKLMHVTQAGIAITCQSLAKGDAKWHNIPINFPYFPILDRMLELFAVHLLFASICTRNPSFHLLSRTITNIIIMLYDY